MRALVAAAVFWLGFDGGTYDVGARTAVGAAIWWAVLVLVLTGALPAAPVPRAAVLVGGLLLAFLVVTASSLAWTASAERTLLEVTRVATYVGAFALAALAATRRLARHVADGIAVGIVGIGAVALGSRLFPALELGGELPEFLPVAATRLSYPVEYWNGLAILVALGVPLILRAAIDAPRRTARAFALASVPALGGVVFLTSSRGGAAVAALGVVTLVALSRRWAAAGAGALGGLGAAAVVMVLASHDALVEGSRGPTAASEGRTAAVLVALACAATGLLYAALERALGARTPPRWLARALVAAGVVAAAIALVAADPAARLETFKRPPPAVAHDPDDLVTEHLLSAGSSGRWQFWAAAVDQFEAEPLRGHGAGSYEAWWAEHGSFSYFLRDAHSLYLETLGELGLLGFAPLVAALAAGIALVIARAVRVGDHAIYAALAAVVVGYAAGAGIDWVWELTVVSLVGITCLGLAVGGGSRAHAALPIGVRVAVATATAAALIACAFVAATDAEVRASQDAAAAGDAEGALAHAERAREVAPWAASPWLQIALVEERLGRLRRARAAVEAALERDRRDWRLWVIRSRLEVKSGSVAQARRSLAEARRLNPRSPLLGTGSARRG